MRKNLSAKLPASKVEIINFNDDDDKWPESWHPALGWVARIKSQIRKLYLRIWITFAPKSDEE